MVQASHLHFEAAETAAPQQCGISSTPGSCQDEQRHRDNNNLNRTTRDWNTRNVTLPAPVPPPTEGGRQAQVRATKGLSERFFAPLRMTLPRGPTP